MESVIGLRFSTLPSSSVRMPSGFHAARTTKPHSRLSRSSLSPPKDPTSLSLGHSSSLSLLKTTGDRPLDHIIGPISCLVYGSLPPSDNRDYRGAANVPWAASFRWNIGWGNRSNHKANKLPKSGNSQSPQQPEADKKRQPDQQLSNIVKRLQQSPHYDLAVKLLKALEMNVEKKDAGISNLNIYNQIMDIVNELKGSQNYNLAVKVLKALEDEPFVQDENSLGTIRFKIMEILYCQGKYKEAFEYWIKLCEMQSPEIKKCTFSKMQSDLFSTMNEVVKCLTKNIPGKKIPSDLLTSIINLEKMDIPKLMNIPGGDDRFLSKAPGDEDDGESGPGSCTQG